MTKSQFRVKEMPPKHYIKRYKQQNELWKIVRQTSFQKPQLQSVLIFFKFVHPCLLLYSCVINTFFSCFERLFLCFTLSGGGSHSLDFDKFCDTAPLKFEFPHVCRIALWWIASRSYLSYFFTVEERRATKGKREKGRGLGPLIAGQARAEIKIIGFFIESIHDRSQISSVALTQMQSINWLNFKKVVFSLKNQHWISTSSSPNVWSKFNDY